MPLPTASPSHRPPVRPRVGGLLLAALAIAFALGALAPLGVFAQKLDRDKPVNIEADRVEVDEQRQESTFIGNVQITQGSMVIRGERIVVRQDRKGFNYGTAFGSPREQAYFRQRRDGTDEYVEGWADRLEYDGRRETVQFFTRARLLRGGDEVRGDYMVYEMATEMFRVLGGGKTGASANNPQGRVRAVLQPRREEDKPGGDRARPAAPGITLKPATGVAAPRE
jgi:lipopolysaccharide export system protein LptA